MEVAEIKTLLEEFAGVFKEPKTLTPIRRFDHKIPLKPNFITNKHQTL